MPWWPLTRPRFLFFCYFMDWRGQGLGEVCFTDTRSQKGIVEDWQASPRSPQESEVHPETEARSPDVLPVVSLPGHSKALGLHVTSSRHHCPGTAAISRKQRRFGSGANAANVAASEWASVGCFLVCGEAVRDGGRDLLHQSTTAFTWRGWPGRDRRQCRARSLQRTHLLLPPAKPYSGKTLSQKEAKDGFYNFLDCFLILILAYLRALPFSLYICLPYCSFPFLDTNART